MNAVSPPALTGTATFRLGTLGSLVTGRFTERVEELGLKPKDVGLLVLLQDRGPASQLDVARAMGVAPSLVVTVADRLETLHAVQRLRDPGDRRRQNLVITERGRGLLARCTAAAQQLDAEFTAALDPTARQALLDALGALAASQGLPS